MVEHFAHDLNFRRSSVFQPKCELEVRVHFPDGFTPDSKTPIIPRLHRFSGSL